MVRTAEEERFRCDARQRHWSLSEACFDYWRSNHQSNGADPSERPTCGLLQRSAKCHHRWIPERLIGLIDTWTARGRLFERLKQHSPILPLGSRALAYWVVCQLAAPGFLHGLYFRSQSWCLPGRGSNLIYFICFLLIEKITSFHLSSFPVCKILIN